VKDKRGREGLPWAHLGWQLISHLFTCR